MQQAIIWINNDLVYWRWFASFCLCALICPSGASFPHIFREYICERFSDMN